MLAQAAYKAGFKALAIDLFGDQDTRFYAEDIQQIPSLAKAHLLPAIKWFVSRYPVACAIYGSGFEMHLDGLRCLASCLTVLGNQPAVLARLQDKPNFFALLESLSIPFPEVSFHVQSRDKRWLRKPMQGEGGIGIRRHRSDDVSQVPVYWQKYQAGEAHSVLFLADGKRSQVIGFNRQWTIALSDTDEFVFSGIINSTALSVEQKAEIHGWLDLLVPELSLKGLNTLDFIQSGQLSYVLEINPRPSASMQLYDADLLTLHIKTCEGELPVQEMAHNNTIVAYQLVYALQNTRIPSDFEWPDGVVDIPIGDSIINAGQPICSIIARVKEPDEVLRQLTAKQEFIIKQLDRFQSHGIQRQRQ